MNQTFTLPSDGRFALVRIPENVQAIAEHSVTATRDAYAHLSAAANGGAKLFEEIASTTRANANAIGQKIIENTAKNADAVFAVAGAMARAKTIQEVAALQTDYMQKQFTLASEQAKELFDLAAGLGKQTIEGMPATVTKAFERDAH